MDAYEWVPGAGRRRPPKRRSAANLEEVIEVVLGAPDGTTPGTCWRCAKLERRDGGDR